MLPCSYLDLRSNKRWRSIWRCSEIWNKHLPPMVSASQPKPTSNKCMCFEQTNKCLKHYKCSKSCKRHSKQVSRVHSEGSQGADSPSIKPKSVRAHTIARAQSTGVRVHTTNPSGEQSAASRETIGRANPTLHSGTTSIPSLPITGQPTMDSTLPEGHTTNARDHLPVLSDLCWQSQPVQVKP